MKARAKIQTKQHHVTDQPLDDCAAGIATNSLMSSAERPRRDDRGHDRDENRRRWRSRQNTRLSAMRRHDDRPVGDGRVEPAAEYVGDVAFHRMLPLCLFALR